MEPDRPRRVISRSRKIVQVEEDLRRALIMSVIGREAAGSAAEVSDALALRFALNADALDLKHAAPNTFIALLPSEALAGCVYNERRPFVVPPLRLHIQRWSRQAMATGRSDLPFLVTVKLCGVLAHLWGLRRWNCYSMNFPWFIGCTQTRKGASIWANSSGCMVRKAGASSFFHGPPRCRASS